MENADSVEVVEEVVEEVAEEGVSQEALDTMSEQVFGVKDEPKEKEDALQQEEEKEKPDETKAEVKEEEVKSTLPASWKKDMQEKWDAIDPDTQSYFLQREQQMQDGLEKDRGDANLGRVMRDVMSPYSEMLKSQGLDESVMVKNLMNAHYRLSTSDDAGKEALIRQFAQSYGINLDGASTEQNPEIKALTSRLSQMEGQITASHEKTLQESRVRVESEVEAFAADPEHPFFDEVSDQIIKLINAGDSLEDAYQNAVWINPVTRQKEMDRATKEAADKAATDAKDEIRKAQKAKATNVKGRDTSKTPTEPTGTMEDTMRATFREIQSR